MQHIGVHSLQWPHFQDLLALDRSKRLQGPGYPVVRVKGQGSGVQVEGRGKSTIPAGKGIDRILMAWDALLVLVEYFQGVL